MTPWVVSVVWAAMALAREQSPGRLARACPLLIQRDDRAALRELDEAIALDPRDAQAYAHRAIARERLKDLAGARQDFAEAGKVPRGAGGPAETRLCSEALRGEWERLGERLERGRAAKNEGVSLFLSGKPRDAIAKFDEAIAQAPGDPQSYQSRAVARESLGDVKGAIADYESACALREDAPDSQAELLASLAEARERSGDSAGAYEDLARALRVASASWARRESLLGRLDSLRSKLPPPASVSPPKEEIKKGAGDRPSPQSGREAEPAVSPRLPSLAGRSQAERRWCLSRLRAVGRRVLSRTERLRRWAEPERTAGLIALLFSGEVSYTSSVDAKKNLTGLSFPDGRTLEMSQADARAHLGGAGAGLLAGLGLGSGLGVEEADALGGRLAIYDLALARLARRECGRPRDDAFCVEKADRSLRPPPGLRVPSAEDPAQARLLAWLVGQDFVRSQLASCKALEPAPFPGQASLMRRLWRKAQNRLDPNEPWVSAGAMAEAIAKAYPWRADARRIVFAPRGRPELSLAKDKGLDAAARACRSPWELIASAWETGEDEGLVPLSPYAAEELAEVLLLMSAAVRRGAPAALWEGRFDPLPEPARKPEAWFVKVPPETSGLRLPAPEAPPRDGDSMGYAPGGIAVLDYDRDGRPDLFLCDFEQARLYRNLGAMRFEDVTEAAGLSGVSCTGASSADFDNDGWPDLLALHGAGKRDRLLRNEGGRFVDVTAEAGISTAPAESTSAVWFDFDRDGLLDLFIAQSGDYYGDLPVGGGAPNGRRNRLYHNLGGRRFEEVAERAGVAGGGWSLAAASFDYDDDGWPDLDVVDDFGFNRLYRNLGDGTFRDVSLEAGVHSLGYGMGVSVADFDRDGRLDMLVTYVGDERVLSRRMLPRAGYRLGAEAYYDENTPRFRQRNRLFRNLGGGKFRDVSGGRIEQVATGWGWNGFFFDADNRGWQDIYQVAGFWPDRLAYADEAKPYWRYNPADGRFHDASNRSGTDFPGCGRVSAYADFDGDGCLDLVTSGYHPVALFAGRCSRGRHWLEVRLEGTRSNRDGIGARVTIKAGAGTQIAEMGSQGGGFESSLLRSLHFGLGRESRVDRVEVRWPSGIRQVVRAVPADQILLVREEAPGGG